MFPSRLTALAVLGTLLTAACGSDSTAPGDAAVPSATAVVSATPVGGTTEVDPNARLSIVFDGAMMPGMERYVDLHRGDVTGPVHSIDCDWSEDYTTLTCTPATPLEPATWYTLHLGGGVRGRSGGPIHMDPDACGCNWAEAGPPDGHGPGEGPMRGQSHAGEPWPMMDHGWRHPNGAYGMVLRFRTS